MGANKSVLLPQDEVRVICDETGGVPLLDSLGSYGFQFRLHAERTTTIVQSLSGVGETESTVRLPQPGGSVDRSRSLTQSVGRTAGGCDHHRLWFATSLDRCTCHRPHFRLGDANRISFRQFANVFARFRRGKGSHTVNSKENKLLFLFGVRTVDLYHETSSFAVAFRFRSTIAITIRRSIAMNCWRF